MTTVLPPFDYNVHSAALVRGMLIKAQKSTNNTFHVLVDSVFRMTLRKGLI